MREFKDRSEFVKLYESIDGEVIDAGNFGMWKKVEVLTNQPDGIDIFYAVSSVGNEAYAKNFAGGGIHRVGGPAQITDQGRFYMQNGIHHREDDKPAIEWSNGSLMWFIKDKKHRLGGPAVIGPDGEESYWLNNQQYSKEEYFAQCGGDNVDK